MTKQEALARVMEILETSNLVLERSEFRQLLLDVEEEVKSYFEDQEGSD